MDSNMKRSIILDNYQDARNRGIPNEDGYIKINSNNDSCIDNIDIYVKLEDDVIKDIKFEGEACVIAISSTSIMSELLIGKTIDEANVIIKNYHAMIDGTEYDADLLEEAIALHTVGKQANRIKCATIGWKAIEEMIAESETQHGK